eukprot:810916_1
MAGKYTRGIGMVLKQSVRWQLHINLIKFKRWTSDEHKHVQNWSSNLVATWQEMEYDLMNLRYIYKAIETKGSYRIYTQTAKQSIQTLMMEYIVEHHLVFKDSKMRTQWSSAWTTILLLELEKYPSKQLTKKRFAKLMEKFKPFDSELYQGVVRTIESIVIYKCT